MRVQEITDKEVWEGFLRECSDKTFLQSWSWGEFQEEMGEKRWRLGVFEGDSLVAAALLVRVRAKRGSFLVIPHGPVTKSSAVIPQVLEVVVEEVRKIATGQDVSFIRINPIWERSEENAGIFKGLGFREAPLQMHPESSWKLSLTPTEEELLQNMRKTTRYLIKKTLENKDISIRQSTEVEDVKTFAELHERVSKRQHFVPFSLEYLQKEFGAFIQDNGASLFLGMGKGELAAASFVVFWSGIGFYHHAASLPEYSKLSISYLLQWEAIQEAKRRGCVLYDFWGYVNPTEQPSHPWAGPTLFKMGFGGEPYLYVKTQDLPLNFKYWGTYVFEKVRKLKRGL